MKQFKAPAFLLALVATLMVATAHGAFAAPPTDLVEIENHGNALVFYPAVEFERMVLTVTGPCEFQYREVSRGREMLFKLNEETIDGVYRFNILREESVAGDVRDLLKQARLENDPTVSKALCREGRLPAAPLAQSSGFLVDRGRIIYDPFAQEEDRSASSRANAPDGYGSITYGGSATGGDGGIHGVSAADFVINDDLIVDGSACIGFDCVNGEVFSFDTIRLKENNLRIKFDDTSVVPSFPANDWQLTANESANGGASKFSIEDVTGSRTPFTVEANARSHSLYVDDGGRIGSRTSTPSVEIHTIDGDTPTLRLQQDGSSGFEPQTWDVAGNETNFFIRDVTNGSTLPFRIRPSAPSNSIFVDVDGDVGFGTSSPDADVEIERSTGNIDFDITTATQSWRFRANNTNGTMGFIDNSSGTAVVRIHPGSVANLLEVGDVVGQVTVNGDLSITGTCSGCDAVFTPEFDLESIEEHAEFMWENSYLPGVGATPEGPTSINVFEKTTGILQELEKAHIYIEQLHNQLKSKSGELESVQERLQRLESLLLDQASETVGN